MSSAPGCRGRNVSFFSLYFTLTRAEKSVFICGMTFKLGTSPVLLSFYKICLITINFIGHIILLECVTITESII